MDAGLASIVVAGLASFATVAAAAIGAWSNSGRATAKATEPLTKEISRLRELVLTLGGDPDEHHA